MVPRQFRFDGVYRSVRTLTVFQKTFRLTMSNHLSSLRRPLGNFPWGIVHSSASSMATRSMPALQKVAPNWNARPEWANSLSTSGLPSEYLPGSEQSGHNHRDGRDRPAYKPTNEEGHKSPDQKAGNSEQQQTNARSTDMSGPRRPRCPNLFLGSAFRVPELAPNARPFWRIQKPAPGRNAKAHELVYHLYV